MSFSSELLEQVLDALGQVLADRGQAQEVVAVGGGSLLLLGLIQRPTKDIDLVALVASVDRGPQSKHLADLRQLAPTSEELDRAQSWCLTHDPSAPFADQLGQALSALGRSSPDTDDGER